MELIIISAIILVFAVLVSIPTLIRNKKLGKRSRAGLGAGLGVLNEIYAPSAKNASIIREQQNESVKPKPSPEDK